jgi:hypothetical protein
MIGVRDTTEEEYCRMREEDSLARRQILVMAKVGKGQPRAF